MNRLPFPLRFAFELVLLSFTALLVSLAWLAATLEARDGVFPTMLALGFACVCLFAVFGALDAHTLRRRVDRTRAVPAPISAPEPLPRDFAVQNDTRGEYRTPEMLLALEAGLHRADMRRLRQRTW